MERPIITIPNGLLRQLSFDWDVDARGAQSGVGEEIQRAMEGYGSTIDRRAVAAVLNARKRGLAV